jgi:hypothetical protein
VTEGSEELAVLIEQALQVRGVDADVKPGLIAVHIAERILRAGYRKP